MTTVFVRSNNFRADLPQSGRSIYVKLPYPTSAFKYQKGALDGLKIIFKEGYHYKKAGIMVMGLSPTLQKQFNIFHNSDPRHLSIMKAVDKVNLLSGHDVVKFGGMDLQQKWKMNRKKLSPNYTSNIKEIISINTIEQDDEKEKLKYLFLSKEAVLKYLFLMVGFLLGFPPLLMILKKIVFL